MTIQTDKPKTKSISPWFYVPSLYFAEGMPYMIINAVSVVFYKNLGIDNAQIAFWTSIINLPWVVKMFWG
ncbi:MAG: MFS transporter, partial [Cyanobacteria bacterium J06629_18]